ncbi:MAG TPA: YciI family protein [Opitutaceae bacterium]|nr:YciI family protein [Opitutaceae bacterium]
MKHIRVLLSIVALFAGASLLAEDAAAPAAAPAPAPKYFLIILRPVERLHNEAAWTEADNAAVYAHFKRLQEAVAAGSVILAGRTEEPLDKTLGLVIFSAADEAEARAFMEGDPCVAAGVMTGELRPYGLALRAK